MNADLSRIALAATFASAFAGCGLLLSDPKESVSATEPDASAQPDGDDSARGNSGANGDPGSDAARADERHDASDAPDATTLGVPDAAAHDAAAHDAATTSANRSVCRALGSAACTCDMPDSGGDYNACSESVGEAALCCADSAWPGGGSCTCLTADCTHPGGGGCTCSPGTRGDTCNDGAVCCVKPGSPCLCTYGITECWSGYRHVAQCDGQAFQCSPGQRKVRSCNVPR